MARRDALGLLLLGVTTAAAAFAVAARPTGTASAGTAMAAPAAAADERVALAELRVDYEAHGVRNGARRSREEARARIDAALARIAGGEAFPAVARECSDAPSRALGGYLGQLRPSSLPAARRAIVASLASGGTSAPFEVAGGFVALQRQPVAVPWPDRIAASHVLISHREALRAPDGTERDRAAAAALAVGIAERLRAGTTTIADEAGRHSDDRHTAARGGALGTVAPERLLPTVVDALLAQPAGAIVGPIETPYGFHVLRRDPADPAVDVAAAAPPAPRAH